MGSGNEMEGRIDNPETLMQSVDNGASGSTDNGKKLMRAYELAYIKYPQEDTSAQPLDNDKDETALVAASLQADAEHANVHTRHEKRMARGVERAQERARNRALSEERNKSERDRIWARIAAYDYHTLVKEYEKYYRGKGQGYYYESREAKLKKMGLSLCYGTPFIVSMISAIACGGLFLIACFMDLIGKNVPFFKYYFPFLAGCLVMSFCCFFLSAKLEGLKRYLIERGYEITEVHANMIFSMLDQRFKKDYPAQYDRFIQWIRQQLILEEQAYLQQQQLAEQRLANENLRQINRDLNDQVGALNEKVEKIRYKLPWWW
jgi:hypothetical protein